MLRMQFFMAMIVISFCNKLNVDIQLMRKSLNGSKLKRREDVAWRHSFRFHGHLREISHLWSQDQNCTCETLKPIGAFDQREMNKR